MAWAEKDGDLLLYVGKCDSWDENGRLLKLGRLRLHFSHNPFAAGQPFRQTLHADRGEIEIVAGESRRRIAHSRCGWTPIGRWSASKRSRTRSSNWRRVWRSGAPRNANWRKNEDHCPIGKLSKDERTKVTPDTILDVPDALAWYHRNERSVWAGTLRHQGLGELIPKFQDPLLGADFRGAGARRTTCASWTARRCVRRRRASDSWSACIRGWRRRASAEDWLAGLRKQAEASDQVALDQARDEHRAWWASFWQRSHLVVSGSPEAERVCQGYNLQRFLQACASRGRFPMKFNGSLFTVDGTRAAARAAAAIPEVYDADFRLWGGGYWFQNCRLLYWPMLMAGDFDLMPPFFRMYQEALPLAEARTRIYFQHGGAFFPETMAFWGTYLNENYGYDRTGKTIPSSDVIASVRGQTQRDPLQPGEVSNTYIRRYWQGGIELLAMMLDYHALTQDERFAEDTLLPLARPILTFYREHYPQRDEQGKIVLRRRKRLKPGRWP